MNAKLKALFAVLFVSAGVTVYVPLSTTTDADLVDAGIGALTTVDRTCQLFGPDCPDGGYCLVELTGAGTTLPDGGVEGVLLTPDIGTEIIDGVAWCLPGTKASARARGTKTVVPFQCACSTGASCQWKGMDGTLSLRTAPTGFRLPISSNWTGSGCVPKACVEIAGVSSWPTSCPQ